MPPKKVVEEEKLGPWSLGRFSSNLKVRPRSCVWSSDLAKTHSVATRFPRINNP